MKIVVNQAMADDGTIVASRYRHDYKVYKSSIFGRESELSVDGGTDYTRRSGSYVNMSIYEDDPFEVIRRFFARINKGKDLCKKPSYTPLYLMHYEWLVNVIKDDCPVNPLYIKELAYRHVKDIYDVKFPEYHNKFDIVCSMVEKDPDLSTDEIKNMIVPNNSSSESMYASNDSYNSLPKSPSNSWETVTELDIRIHNLFNKYSKMSLEQIEDTTPFDVLNELNK